MTKDILSLYLQIFVINIKNDEKTWLSLFMTKGNNKVKIDKLFLKTIDKITIDDNSVVIIS